MKNSFLKFLALVCLLSFLFACNKSESQDSSHANSADTTDSNSLKSQLKSAPDTPGITLLDEGTGDKISYRYQITPGQEYKSIMNYKMKQIMKIDNQLTPGMPIPTIKMPFNIVFSDKQGDLYPFTGKYEQVQLVPDPSIPPQIFEQLSQIYSYFSQIRFTGLCDELGSLTDFGFEGTEALPPQLGALLDQMKTSLSNLFVGLPREPIGDGAKWLYVVDNLKLGGMTQSIKYIYQIDSRQDKKLLATIESLSHIPAQDVTESPGLAPGMKLRVEEVDNYGSGSITLDMTKPMPIGINQGTYRVNMVASGGELKDKTQRIEVETTMEVGLEVVE